MAKINWQFDPAHSEVRFKVRHMMVSNVSGEFKNFDIQLETEGLDFSTAKAKFTADIDSIDTKVDQRNNHLKSEDFFDSENHPKLSFESTKVTKLDDDEYEMEGNLTMRGTTKPVKFNVENVGLLKEGENKYRAGFEITGKVKRLPFGLKYNPLLETGGLVIGDDVKININTELLHEGAVE